MSTTLGRIPSSQVAILDDTPSQKVAAMLRKLDELNVAIKGIADDLDSDSGVTGTTFGSDYTDDLDKLELTG